MENNPIRPSDGFAERVMIKALEAEKRRVRMTGLLFGIVIFAPLIARLAWTWVRHDYFSISHWPLAHLISRTYHIFMSPSVLYILAIAGTTGFFYFIGIPQWRTRQIFSQFRSRFS